MMIGFVLDSMAKMAHFMGLALAVVWHSLLKIHPNQNMPAVVV